MNNHLLSAKQLNAGYGTQTILSDISLQIPPNKISVILGANGCGKSTLLKTFSRLLKPSAGQVLLDGSNVYTYSSKQVAKTIGLLPQSPTVPEGIKVTDLIMRGRFPYRQLLKGVTSKDFEAVELAMKMMGITDLANRYVDELSGGQRQRVWIALSLAQQTDILLLDEPTTFLDIAYQIEILDLLTELNRKLHTTIVMILHDINLSARYADYLFAMAAGAIEAQGTPAAILTPSLIQTVYGISCRIIEDPVSKTPMILPIGRYHSGETAIF